MGDHTIETQTSKNDEQKYSLPVRLAVLIVFGLVVVLFGAGNAFAWPLDGDWIPLYNSSGFMGDATSDASGQDCLELVGDDAYPLAYIYTDDVYINYRIRIDGTPLDNSGTALKPFGWGFLVDLDGDFDAYEYMVMLDGVNNPDAVFLGRNDLQGTLGDPSDKAETILWQEGLTYNGNFRVTDTALTASSSSFNGSTDYFVDYRVPFDIFTSTLGIEDHTLISYFIGTSTQGQSLVSDLVASALSLGLSEPVLPSGQRPTSGTVRFVTDATGATDLINFYPGSNLFVKVTDLDQNATNSVKDTVIVTLTTPSGDVLSISLTETDYNSGIFIGYAETEYNSANTGDSTLQLNPIELVTVTYVDAADENFLTDQFRTDTARALPAADVGIVKSVDIATPNEGDYVTYNVVVTNYGPSNANGIAVLDQLDARLIYNAASPSQGTFNDANGIWSVGSLAVGSSARLLINAQVTSGTTLQTIPNTASQILPSSQPDPQGSNDSDTANISVTGSDLSVGIVSPTNVPDSGDTITITLNAMNLGNYDAGSVTVSGLLPAGLTFVSASASAGSYDETTGIWDFGTLANLGSETLTITATVTAGTGTQIFYNALILSGTQGDPSYANNEYAFSFLIGGSDLSLSKTRVTSATPDIYDLVTFEVTVTNPLAGNGATGIEVTDLLPDGLSYNSTQTVVPGGSTYNSTTGIWTISTLAAGSSTTLELSANVLGNMAGRTIVNDAEITLAPGDPNTANNSSSASLTVRATNIRVVKTASTLTPVNSAKMQFWIDVTNTGPLDATGVQIYDDLPDTYLDEVKTVVTPDRGSYDATTNLWNIGALAAGETVRITFDVTIKTQGDSFFNNAMLYSTIPGDNDGTDNSSSVYITIDGTDFLIDKVLDSASTNTPATGDTVNFLVSITNLGPNSAKAIEVKDLLPPGLTWVTDGTVTPKTTIGSYSDTTGIWNLGNNYDFQVGTTHTLTIKTTVSAPSGTIITNRAQLEKTPQPDPVSVNNYNTVTLYVGAADLAITKSYSPANPTEGTLVTYNVLLENLGPNDVDRVKVDDLLSSWLTFTGSSGTGTYNSSTGRWEAGSIAVGGSAKMLIQATVNAGSSGEYVTNTASIYNSSGVDQNSANNSASANFTVQSADVYVNKIVSTSNPYEGDTITYTLKTGNHGPDTATGVSVVDLLPGGLTFVSASSASYSAATGIWTIGNLAKDAEETLVLTVQVNGGTGGGPSIVNTLSYNAVTAQISDPISTNNSSSVSISPRTSAVDLRIVKDAGTSSVVEGGSVVFSVHLYNDGVQSASGIEVTDQLPTGMQYVSSSSPSGTTYNSISGIWDVGTLAPLDNLTLTITASVPCGSYNSAVPVIYNNVASVSLLDQSELTPSNNYNSAKVTVTAAPPSLMIIKSASGSTAQSGQVINYLVQAVNSGCGKATNLVFSDHLSEFTAWDVVGYNSPTPFSFTDSVPPSGLSLGVPEYSEDGGTSWLLNPVSEGGGAPVGYDGRVTNWKLPMTGSMRSGAKVQIRYWVIVE